MYQLPQVHPAGTNVSPATLSLVLIPVLLTHRADAGPPTPSQDPREVSSHEGPESRALEEGVKR